MSLKVWAIHMDREYENKVELTWRYVLLATYVAILYLRETVPTTSSPS